MRKLIEYVKIGYSTFEDNKPTWETARSYIQINIPVSPLHRPWWELPRWRKWLRNKGWW